MTAPSADRIPVIVGVGEITDRPSNLSEGLEPLALMEIALQRAADDAGGDCLSKIDSLDVVNEVSWPYADAPAQLGRRLNLNLTHSQYGEIGGESPVRFIHEAALRIARGECRVAAVVGAESTQTVSKAARSDQPLPWSQPDPTPRMVKGKDLVHPLSLKHGIFAPVSIYPLYENAASAAWAQSPRDARDESARMWQRFAEVAAENPGAWTRDKLSFEDIVLPSQNNRLIAWPYSKFLIANPMVNQGAAVLLTSLAQALEMGIDEHQLVFVLGGAAARETQDYLQRENFHRSDAQDAVLRKTMEMAGGNVKAITELELYSCFPCVPKMARRTLGLDEGVTPTVVGGLSFFGAPLNNYMTHAAVGMVRRMRGNAQGLGLLYGQGEFVTKHHALLIGAKPPVTAMDQSYSVQSEVDKRRGEVPELVEVYEGEARLETFTVIYDRDGEITFGFVIARTPQGYRILARVPASDRVTLTILTCLDRSPVGEEGNVTVDGDNLLRWRF